MGVIGDAWGLLQKVYRLTETQEAQSASIKALAGEVAELDRRLHTLETREGMIISEAKAAARAASHEATQGTVSELSRRLGMLEGRDSVPTLRKARLKDSRKE